MNATLDRNRTELVNRISQIKKEIKNYEFLWAQARGDWNLYTEIDIYAAYYAEEEMAIYDKELTKLRQELEELESQIKEVQQAEECGYKHSHTCGYFPAHELGWENPGYYCNKCPNNLYNGAPDGYYGCIVLIKK